MLDFSRSFRKSRTEPTDDRFAAEVAQVPADTAELNVVVLVHGYLGNAQELSYLQQALESRALQGSVPILVHSATANEGRTADGIAAGGQRLAAEVVQLLDAAKKQCPSAKLSFSIVGNSLGGLYARYALHHVLSNNSAVQPKVFVSTCTPHLGMDGHTCLPLPRPLQLLSAKAMQQTGQDLFRFSSVIDDLTTDPEHVEPLSRFQHRLAYANSFGTDFQVPTSTAAMVTALDTSLHHRCPSNHDMIAVEVETKPTDLPPPTPTGDRLSAEHLAERLNALGWHKVFCNVSQDMSSMPVPFWHAKTLEDKNTYTGAELQAALAHANRIYWPTGHCRLVANAKDAQAARDNAMGRPLMDHLAAQLVNAIRNEAR